jgi:Flp pilus assembly protein TadD
MIRQTHYIGLSVFAMLILVSAGVQADDEQNASDAERTSKNVPTVIVPPQPVRQVDAQRGRVRVVDPWRWRAADADEQGTTTRPQDAWLHRGFEGTPYPRVVVRGRPGRWGRSWDRPRFLRRYAPYGYYGHYDALGVQSALEEAYFAGRLDQRQDARLRWNRRDMARRKARLLSKHAEALELGLGKLKQGEYARAVIGLTLAAELNNGDPACRIHLAQARLALGQYAEAGKVLRRALQLQHKLVYADLQLPKYYPNGGKFDECADALAAWVKKHPASTDVYFLLGYVQFQRGNFEQAYAAFRRVAQVMPGDPLTQAYLEITKPPGN